MVSDEEQVQVPGALAAAKAAAAAEEEEEDLFVFNDTIEGPRAPAALRINLNVEGCGIVAAPVHAPSLAPLLLPLPSFTRSPSPPRSLVRDGQTSPHRLQLVVSRSTCPPLSPSPHANSFIIGTAVINTRPGPFKSLQKFPGQPFKVEP
jgi:hypothetical protein